MSKEIDRLDKGYIKNCLDKFDGAVLDDVGSPVKKDGNFYLKFKYFLKAMREILIREAKNAYLEDEMIAYREKVNTVAEINLRINLAELGLDEIRKYGEGLKVKAFASDIIDLWNNSASCINSNGCVQDGIFAVTEKMSSIEKDATVQLQRYLSNFSVSEMDIVRKVLGLNNDVSISEYKMSLKENYESSKKSVDDMIEYDVSISACQIIEDWLNSAFKQIGELSEILEICSTHKNVVIGRESNIGIRLGNVEDMVLDKEGSKDFISTDEECIEEISSKKEKVIWHLKYGASALGISIILLIVASYLPDESYFTSQFDMFLGKIGIYLGSVGSLGVSLSEFRKAIKEGKKNDVKKFEHRLSDRRK